MSILDKKESNIRRKIIEFLSSNFPDIYWHSQRLDGFGQIDVFGMSPKFVYIIEVELKREDPVNNVAKIYRYLDETEMYQNKRVVFIHAFSPKYLEGSFLTKRLNAEFIGQKMQEAYLNVEYHSFIYEDVESLNRNILNLIKRATSES